MTAPSGDHDRLFEEWRTWVREVQNALYTVHYHREIWREMRVEMADRAPNSDGTFLSSYTRLYVDGVLMTIRRLADPDVDTRSLVSLILAIQRNPGVMTRERYGQVRRNRNPDLAEWAPGENEWDRNFAAADGTSGVDPAILSSDVARLTAELEHVVAWATKVVAHIDPRRPERVPLLTELDASIDLLAEIADRYVLLLEQSVNSVWTPTIIGDWKAPFRPALFPIPVREDPRSFS